MARAINLGAAFGLLMVVLSQYASAQTLHVVGDNLGWNILPGGAQAYTNWANGKSFSVGDTLLFNFTTGGHDVLQVTKASFDGCTSSNPIGDMINTGPANVTLSTAGEHFYICTISGHCNAGQKLAITVSGTPMATPPSRTPAPSTPRTTPSPTNSPDACAPTPAEAPTNPTANPTPSNPTTSPPGSSASNVLASFFVSILAIGVGLIF